MGIINFKNYISEKLGVAEASLFYIDQVFNKTWYNFLEFYQDEEDKLYEEDIRIPYSEIKPYITNTLDYVMFPVTGIDLHLNFKKSNQIEFEKRYRYIFKSKKIKFSVTGFATNFGHRNWTGYSKATNPVKKLSDHGIIINCGISIDISPSFNVNSNEDKKKMITDIKETIWHELNHLYEYYHRFIHQSGVVTSRAPNIAITLSDENKWGIPKDIYDEWLYNFSYYLYASEPHELNAQVQEVAFFVTEHGFDSVYKTHAWKVANYMEKFSADKFINHMKDFITDFAEKRMEKDGKTDYVGAEDRVFQRLKNMWVSRYEKYTNEHKERPIMPIDTLKKMTYEQFIRYFEKRLNQSGTYLKKKIGKLSSL